MEESPNIVLSCIYWIINLVNGKIYIGSAKDGMVDRWKEHRNSLYRKDHFNFYLQRAWDKYGEDCFAIQELEKVDDVTKLVEREQYWMDYYQCCDRKIGYNLSPTAGSTLGVKCSEDKKEKISKANKGRKLSEEHKRKLSESEKGEKNPFYGKHHSEETKILLRELNKGKMPWNFGKSWNEESKRKMSQSQSGENSWKAKLSWEQVREIRQKYIPYKYTMKMLAKEYGVSWKCICGVVYNETWKEENVNIIEKENDDEAKEK